MPCKLVFLLYGQSMAMASAVFRKLNSQFMLGVCLGLSFTIILHIYDSTLITTNNKGSRLVLTADQHQLSNVIRQESKPSSGTADSRHYHDGDDPMHDLIDSTANIKEQHFDDTQHHHDDDTLARDLYKRVRVACWILTSPSNLDRKTIHVKNTWAKRCNLVLFMSSVRNDSFPTVGLNVSEGREHLTAKTMQAFKYMYDHHFDDADWFMKADDDTYVILENLRYFLSDENPEEPVFFGHRFKPHVKQGYPSGGGGYILSKEALRRYGKDGTGNSSLCAKDLGAEDVQMGKCLQNLGVRLKPSLDSMQRTRFHCFSPETMLKAVFPSWYNYYVVEGAYGGIENISDYAISFHYVSPDKMYALEFYTYHLQPYGILSRPQALNVKS